MKFLLSHRARVDLKNIVEYIQSESGERKTAEYFASRLVEKCRELAGQPFEMGRVRPELGVGIRTYAMGNYLIFFRYSNEVMEVVAIVEGHRDIEALF